MAFDLTDGPPTAGRSGWTPSCATPIRRRSSPRPSTTFGDAPGAGLLVRRGVGGAAAPGRRRSNRDIPVLFLDTGMLFGQTLDYRQQLAARLGLTDVRDLRPALRGPGHRRSQRRPLADRHRRLLPHPQGDAAGRGAGRLRRPGSPAASASTAATACACRWSRQADGTAEVQSAGQLDQGRPRRLRRRARPAGASAGRRSASPRSAAGRAPSRWRRARRARRPLGGFAKDRMRHTYRPRARRRAVPGRRISEPRA